MPQRFRASTGCQHSSARARGSVVCWWWLGLEGFVPPPVCALTGGSSIGRHGRRGFRRWTGERSRAELPSRAVGDGQVVRGSGDGDDPSMVQPMVVRTHQDEVVQLGGAAVFPMADVMGVQTTSGAATGHRTRGMAMLQGTTKSAVDHPRRSTRADDLPVAFEPHLAHGVTRSDNWRSDSVSSGPRCSAATRSLTSTCTTTVVCCPCGRRAASASHPASTNRMNASPAPGSGGRFGERRSSS